jgi:hypothetical protein
VEERLLNLIAQIALSLVVAGSAQAAESIDPIAAKACIFGAISQLPATSGLSILATRVLPYSGPVATSDATRAGITLQVQGYVNFPVEIDMSVGGQDMTVAFICHAKGSDGKISSEARVVR